MGCWLSDYGVREKQAAGIRGCRTQGITDVVKRDLATEEARTETVKELRGLEREEAEHLVACLKLYEGRIQVVRGQMEIALYLG